MMHKSTEGCETILRSHFPVLHTTGELFAQASKKRGGNLSCWLLRDGAVVYAADSNHDDSAAKVLQRCGQPVNADAALALMHLTGAIRLRVTSSFVQAILAVPPVALQAARIVAIVTCLPKGSGIFRYDFLGTDGIETLAEGDSLSEFEEEIWNDVFRSGIQDGK